MNIYQDLFRFAYICYSEPTGKENLFYNCLDFVPMQNSTDYGFIAYYKDRIVIAFRGTRGGKAWIEDFDAIELVEGNTIHHGFYSAWSEFKKPIEDYLNNYYKSQDGAEITLPVYCTGHSRGAALTTLCARHLKKNMKLPVNVSNINFGSPAVGNGKFRDQYSLLGIDTTRIVNGYDLGPCLPPQSLGYRHVGALINLPQPLIHKLRFLRIIDHVEGSYKKALDKVL